jgi:broad specificity phosphatase PhoE
MKRADRQRTRAFPATPPSPEQTTQMVAQGIDVNRGSSDQQPLSPPGKQEVQELGAKLAAKGGLDSLRTSATERGNETAASIKQAQPALPVTQDKAAEQSWAQGALEGQPMASVRDQIRDLIRNNPSVKIPGQGALASQPGESFDDFRTRALSAVRGDMQELAQDPSKKLGRTTHTQVVKLMRGWLANGTPDDLSVKPEHMEDKAEAPGQVVRLYPNENGKWNLEDVNLEDQKQLDGGLYYIRHGMTPWNRETYEKANGQQDAIQAITKHTKQMNWSGVQSAATEAIKNGHMTEDQVGQAIDSALPDPRRAATLPLHRLVAVASAASPERRQQYAETIRGYPGIESLPPDAKEQIMNHLRMIGLEA